MRKMMMAGLMSGLLAGAMVTAPVAAYATPVNDDGFGFERY